MKSKGCELDWFTTFALSFLKIVSVFQYQVSSNILEVVLAYKIAAHFQHKPGCMHSQFIGELAEESIRFKGQFPIIPNIL